MLLGVLNVLVMLLSVPQSQRLNGHGEASGHLYLTGYMPHSGLSEHLHWHLGHMPATNKVELCFPVVTVLCVYIFLEDFLGRGRGWPSQAILAPLAITHVMAPPTATLTPKIQLIVHSFLSAAPLFTSCLPLQ